MKEVYAYQAALLCAKCGERTRTELTQQGKAPTDPTDESSYDSWDFPKGPFTDAQPGDVCDQCGRELYD